MAQELWDQYVNEALERATVGVTRQESNIAAIQARINVLATSEDENVVAVKQRLGVRLAQANRVLARMTTLQTAMESRLYDALTTEQQGFVEFIHEKTPAEVLRIGAQNVVDIEQYYTLGVTASASLAEVIADLAEEDYIEIAYQVLQKLQSSS